MGTQRGVKNNPEGECYKWKLHSETQVTCAANTGFTHSIITSPYYNFILFSSVCLSLCVAKA